LAISSTLLASAVTSPNGCLLEGPGTGVAPAAGLGGFSLVRDSFADFFAPTAADFRFQLGVFLEMAGFAALSMVKGGTEILFVWLLRGRSEGRE
jgi:hypothetical protein